MDFVGKVSDFLRLVLGGIGQRSNSPMLITSQNPILVRELFVLSPSCIRVQDRGVARTGPKRVLISDVNISRGPRQSKGEKPRI